MPLNNNKPHELSLSIPPNVGPTTELLVCRFTGEVFTDYEDYIKAVNHYRQRTWSCKVTGKSGLTYEEAMTSEDKSKTIVGQFPACYEEPIIHLVHHATLKVDDLCQKILSHFKDRFVVGEEVTGIRDGVLLPCQVLSIRDPQQQPRFNDGIAGPSDMANGVTTHFDLKYEVQWLPNHMGVAGYSVLRRAELIRKRNPLTRPLLKSWIPTIATVQPIEAVKGVPCIWRALPHIAKEYHLQTHLPQELSERLQKAAKRKEAKARRDMRAQMAEEAEAEKMRPHAAAAEFGAMDIQGMPGNLRAEAAAIAAAAFAAAGKKGDGAASGSSKRRIPLDPETIETVDQVEARIQQGSIKNAVFQLLKVSGPEGMEVGEIISRIERAGIKQWPDPRSARTSISAQCAHEPAFVRVAPGRFALKALTHTHLLPQHAPAPAFASTPAAIANPNLPVSAEITRPRSEIPTREPSGRLPRNSWSEAAARLLNPPAEPPAEPPLPEKRPRKPKHPSTSLSFLDGPSHPSKPTKSRRLKDINATAASPRTLTHHGNHGQHATPSSQGPSPPAEKKQKIPEPIKPKFDKNSTKCSVCHKTHHPEASPLVLCDTCPRSFHMLCQELEWSDLPEGDWSCPKCQQKTVPGKRRAATVEFRAHELALDAEIDEYERYEKLSKKERELEDKARRRVEEKAERDRMKALEREEREKKKREARKAARYPIDDLEVLEEERDLLFDAELACHELKSALSPPTGRRSSGPPVDPDPEMEVQYKEACEKLTKQRAIVEGPPAYERAVSEANSYALLADALAVVEFVALFGSLTEAKPMNIHEFLHSVVWPMDSGVLSQLYVALLRCLLLDRVGFENVERGRARRWARVIDEQTWPEVLRRYLLSSRSSYAVPTEEVGKSHVAVCDDHTVCIIAAQHLANKPYYAMGPELHIRLLAALCNDIMEGHNMKTEIDHRTELFLQVQADKHALQMEEKRRAREEEAKKKEEKNKKPKDEEDKGEGKAGVKAEDGTAAPTAADGADGAEPTFELPADLQEFSGNETDRKAYLAWKARRNDAEAKLNEKRRHWEREQLKKDKEKTDELKKAEAEAKAAEEEKKAAEEERVRLLAEYEETLNRVQRRSTPLGWDRHYHRYWWMAGAPSVVFVEDSDGTGMSVITSKDQLDDLLNRLNVKGVKEKELLEEMRKRYDEIAGALEPMTAPLDVYQVPRASTTRTGREKVQRPIETLEAAWEQKAVRHAATQLETLITKFGAAEAPLLGGGKEWKRKLRGVDSQAVLCKMLRELEGEISVLGEGLPQGAAPAPAVDEAEEGAVETAEDAVEGEDHAENDEDGVANGAGSEGGGDEDGAAAMPEGIAEDGTAGTETTAEPAPEDDAPAEGGAQPAQGDSTSLQPGTDGTHEGSVGAEQERCQEAGTSAGREDAAPAGLGEASGDAAPASGQVREVTPGGGEDTEKEDEDPFPATGPDEGMDEEEQEDIKDGMIIVVPAEELDNSDGEGSKSSSTAFRLWRTARERRVWLKEVERASQCDSSGAAVYAAAVLADRAQPLITKYELVAKERAAEVERERQEKAAKAKLEKMESRKKKDVARKQVAVAEPVEPPKGKAKAKRPVRTKRLADDVSEAATDFMDEEEEPPAPLPKAKAKLRNAKGKVPVEDEEVDDTPAAVGGGSRGRRARPDRSTAKQQAAAAEAAEEGDEDRWSYTCVACGLGGDLLCCEYKGCSSTMHLDCAGLSEVPKGIWYCFNHPEATTTRTGRPKRAASVAVERKASAKKTRSSPSSRGSPHADTDESPPTKPAAKKLRSLNAKKGS